MNKMRNTPLRIVIWGYGIRGKQIHNNIVSDWNAWINVVGFADNDESVREQYERCDERCYSKIYDISDVERMYQNKEIDGVIIGVAKEDFYQQIKEQLELRKIAIYEYPEDDSELISVEDIKYECLYVADGKKKVYVLQDMNVAIDHWNTTTWVYNNNKRIKEGVAENYQIELLKPKVPLVDEMNPKAFLEGEICILSLIFTMNYWHFLYEALVKILMLEENNYQGRYMLFDKPYIRELIKLLQLPDERFVWVDVEKYKTYKCEKVLIFSDITSSCEIVVSYMDRWAKELTNRYFGGMKRPSNCFSKVFVKRIGIRRLNVSEKILEKYGFHTIVPEELSVLEQIKVFYFADIIITPHGANSSNVLFMKDGKIFIETFGYQYINPCCMDMIKHKKIDYHMLVERRGIVMKDKQWAADYEIPELWMDIVLGKVCEKLENDD